MHGALEQQAAPTSRLAPLSSLISSPGMLGTLIPIVEKGDSERLGLTWLGWWEWKWGLTSAFLSVSPGPSWHSHGEAGDIACACRPRAGSPPGLCPTAF